MATAKQQYDQEQVSLGRTLSSFAKVLCETSQGSKHLRLMVAELTSLSEQLRILADTKELANEAD